MDTKPFSRSGRCKESVFADASEAPSGLLATPQSFAWRIDALINASKKTQRQIAAELGYDKPNIITVSKQGTTRVPPDKVGPLAHALDADPIDLLRLWYEAYEPHMVPVIEQSFGDFLSSREKALIGALRRRLSGASRTLLPFKPPEPQCHNRGHTEGGGLPCRRMVGCYARPVTKSPYALTPRGWKVTAGASQPTRLPGATRGPKSS